MADAFNVDKMINVMVFAMVIAVAAIIVDVMVNVMVIAIILMTAIFMIHSLSMTIKKPVLQNSSRSQ